MFTVWMKKGWKWVCMSIPMSLHDAQVELARIIERYQTFEGQFKLKEA